MKSVAWGAVIMTIGGCTEADVPPTQLPSSVDEAEMFLAERIPRGTPVDAAERELEKWGFGCIPGDVGAFDTRAAAGTFVFCERLSKVDAHQVALVHQQRKILRVLVHYQRAQP
jgi:hypothetical protein